MVLFTFMAGILITRPYGRDKGSAVAEMCQGAKRWGANDEREWARHYGSPVLLPVATIFGTRKLCYKYLCILFSRYATKGSFPSEPMGREQSTSISAFAL